MGEKLTKAQITALRRGWAKRARTIDRKAVELHVAMMEALGDAHEATDYSDGMTVHTEELVRVLESDGYEMWDSQALQQGGAEQ